MTPQVSIVVTCYNYGKYVAGCLASLQEQTFQNFEVIVVDDGSTDDSEEQVRSFLDDPRFRYIKQDNGGQANAKNRGIKESSGELVAFLDADDQWDSTKLEQQVPLFFEANIGVVYSRTAYINTQGELQQTDPEGQYILPRKGCVTKYLIYDNFVPFSSAVVRRDYFEKFGMFDESLAMGIDWDLWLRFSTKVHFDYIDKKLLLYRVGHSDQMSKNLLERFLCADRIVAKFFVEFPKVLPDTVVNDATYYSYCLRGYVLRNYGIAYPLKYYGQAILLFPLRKKAYLGLVKTMIKTLIGR